MDTNVFLHALQNVEHFQVVATQRIRTTRHNSYQKKKRNRAVNNPCPFYASPYNMRTQQNLGNKKSGMFERRVLRRRAISV